MIENPPPGSAQKNLFTNPPNSPNKPQNRTTLIIIVVIAVLAILLFCCCPLLIGAIASSMSTPTPKSAVRASQTQPVDQALPEATSAPLDTPIPAENPSETPAATQTLAPALSLSLTQFMNKYNNLTDIQKKDFIPQSKGKSVNWSGKIANVSEDGTITISIPNTLASTVSLKGISPEDAVKLSKGQTIQFTGQITDIIDLLGMHIYLENVQLSSAAKPTDAAQPTDSSSVSPTPQAASNIISAGTYLVGSDIKPGIYKSEGSDSCYWARLKDLTGNVESIIANANTKGSFYIEIKPSDNAIEIHCELVPLSSVPKVSEFPKNIGPGIYIVGKDIQPGTYKGTVGSDFSEACYWARLKDVTGEIESVIANNNATGQFYVQVASSDFALSVACQLDFVKQ